MDFEQIVKDSKRFRLRIFQSMIIVLIAGAMLAYFRTTETEMWLAGICAIVAILLCKKYYDLTGFIHFLESGSNKTSSDEDIN